MYEATNTTNTTRTNTGRVDRRREPRKLRLLLVGADRRGRDAVVDALGCDPSTTLEELDERSELPDVLGKRAYDCLLLGCSAPPMEVEELDVIHECLPVVYAGMADWFVEALRCGAHDCVATDELDRKSLLAAIERATRLHAAERDRDRLERDLAWLAGRMTAADRTLRSLLTILAHDMRNPLNRMELAAGLLDSAVLPEGAIALGAVRRAVSALDGHTSALQELATRSLRPDLERAPTALANLLWAAIDEAASAAVRWEVRVALDTAAVPPLEVDAERCLAVFSSIVRDAILRANGEVEVLLESAHDGAHIAIEDDGPSVGGGERGKVLERLTYAGMIVDAHGGSLRLDECGSGNCVRVFLPRC